MKANCGRKKNLYAPTIREDDVMSLNRMQKKQTSEELKKNYQISGLTPVEIQHGLGLDFRMIEETLKMSPNADPTNVWRLRDYMEEKIIEQGKKPFPYSVLKVNRWFQYK